MSGSHFGCRQKNVDSAVSVSLTFFFFYWTEMRKKCIRSAVWASSVLCNKKVSEENPLDKSSENSFQGPLFSNTSNKMAVKWPLSVLWATTKAQHLEFRTPVSCACGQPNGEDTPFLGWVLQELALGSAAAELCNIIRQRHGNSWRQRLLGKKNLTYC